MEKGQSCKRIFTVYEATTTRSGNITTYLSNPFFHLFILLLLHVLTYATGVETSFLMIYLKIYRIGYVNIFSKAKVAFVTRWVCMFINFLSFLIKTLGFYGTAWYSKSWHRFKAICIQNQCLTRLKSFFFSYSC